VSWSLACTVCHTRYPGLEVRYRCDCGETLDVVHDLEALRGRLTAARFDRRLGSRLPEDRSGVWRFRELVLPLAAEEIVTHSEGNTPLYASSRVAQYVGVDALLLKHEGENPTGSFKDRGMTVGITLARKLGIDTVACASTGNTSASMAAYASLAGMRAVVFIPEGKIARGKLAQALAYGARTLQIDSDFDAAMALVEQVCRRESIYLLNSINPFRIEGQKAIGFELLQDLGWEVPDWIVVPGGNLGNSSAIFKGLEELASLGIIPRLPRLAVVQAEGANPLYTAFREGRELEPVEHAVTLATAIRIGNPVSWRKSLRGVRSTGGVVEQVSDQEILDAKAIVDAAGIGAEPASCASVAGARKLVAGKVITAGDKVCCILTGHLLKDPDLTVAYHLDGVDGIRSTFRNAPVRCAADLEAVLAALRGGS
jgi:threonine synthase